MPPGDPWLLGTRPSNCSCRRRAPAARPQAVRLVGELAQRARPWILRATGSRRRTASAPTMLIGHVLEDQPPDHVGHSRKDLRELRPAARMWIGGIARMHAGSTPRVGQGPAADYGVAPGPRCVWMSVG